MKAQSGKPHRFLKPVRFVLTCEVCANYLTGRRILRLYFDLKLPLQWVEDILYPPVEYPSNTAMPPSTAMEAQSGKPHRFLKPVRFVLTAI